MSAVEILAEAISVVEGSYLQLYNMTNIPDCFWCLKC